MALEGLQGWIASIGPEQSLDVRYWAYMAWTPMFYQVGGSHAIPRLDSRNIDDFLKISCWYYHLQLLLFVQLWLLIHHPKTSTLDPDCEKPAKVLL